MLTGEFGSVLRLDNLSVYLVLNALQHQGFRLRIINLTFDVWKIYTFILNYYMENGVWELKVFSKVLFHYHYNEHQEWVRFPFQNKMSLWKKFLEYSKFFSSKTRKNKLKDWVKPFLKRVRRTSTMKIIMSENFPFDVSLDPEFSFQQINKKKLTKRGRLRNNVLSAFPKIV